MKKKASLLISGVTTVAMLAVAVGSFAAWDKLTPATDPSFTATSGAPAIVKVTTGAGESKALVPDGSVLGTNDTKSLLVGTFTPDVVDNTDASSTEKYNGVKIYFEEPKLSSTKIVDFDKTKFKVVVKDETDSIVANKTDLTENKPYKVYLEFAEADSVIGDADAAKYAKADDIKVDIVIKGTTGEIPTV